MQTFEPIEFTSPFILLFLTNLDFCSENVYNGEMS